MNEHIPTGYAVLVVSEILLEKGLINRATFDELAKRLKRLICTFHKQRLLKYN